MTSAISETPELVDSGTASSLTGAQRQAGTAVNQDVRRRKAKEPTVHVAQITWTGEADGEIEAVANGYLMTVRTVKVDEPEKPAKPQSKAAKHLAAKKSENEGGTPAERRRQRQAKAAPKTLRPPLEVVKPKATA